MSYAIYHFAQSLPGLLKASMRFYGWMKIPTLAAAVTMIAITVPLDVTFGQTTPKQEAAKIPSDLLALLQKNLKEDELEETKSCLEREGVSWSEILRATRFDLDRPRRWWLLEGLGPCLAGNANDLKLLYIVLTMAGVRFSMNSASRWFYAPKQFRRALSRAVLLRNKPPEGLLDRGNGNKGGQV